jgi:hypothetical protein
MRQLTQKWSRITYGRTRQGAGGIGRAAASKFVQPPLRVLYDETLSATYGDESDDDVDVAVQVRPTEVEQQ